MRGKIWIDDMSESDRALAFKAVQKLDGFYRRRTVGQYKCFYLRSETDVWNDVSIDCYRESELPEITLQQLLKLAGMEEFMTTKQFSKKDLVAGKYVVELADGSRYLLVNVLDKIIGFNLLADSKGIHDNWYTHLEEDLVYPYNKDLSVVAVYKVISINVYCQCSESNIELVWQRTEKSASQIELEKLQQQIADLQAQANKLQSTL